MTNGQIILSIAILTDELIKLRKELLLGRVPSRLVDLADSLNETEVDTIGINFSPRDDE